MPDWKTVFCSMELVRTCMQLLSLSMFGKNDPLFKIAALSCTLAVPITSNKFAFLEYLTLTVVHKLICIPSYLVSSKAAILSPMNCRQDSFNCSALYIAENSSNSAAFFKVTVERRRNKLVTQCNLM